MLPLEMRIESLDNRKRPAVSSVDQAKKHKAARPFKLKKLTGAYTEFANYNDEIHETIECCPVMKVIMDTKYFQRLRKIHQLGTAWLLYGNATHSRFEHSLGVAKLAKDLCEYVREQQPGLETTDKDVLCVTMAGLTHDMGHGLFSHVYEDFRREIDKQIKTDPEFKEKYKDYPVVPKKWSHERSSLAMIDAALASQGLEIDMDEANLDKPLKQIGDGIDARSMRVFKGRTTPKENEDEDIVLTNRDWIFIKECIYGKPLPEVKEKLGHDEWIGRLEPEKEWLYDVVSNRHNGIDVDKVDYFARDARRSQASRNGRINVRVLREVTVGRAKCSDRKCAQCRNGHHYMICYPEKCIKDIRSFFETRFDMHEAVYQHKTTTASSCMLVDILKHADLHYLLKGKNHKALPLSRAVLDSEAFYRLKDDAVIENIANSDLEAMKPAQILAERFLCRDLYKLSGEKIVDLTNPYEKELWEVAESNPNQIAREIYEVKGKRVDDSDGREIVVEFEDIVVNCSTWHCGRKDANPLEAVRFVEKRDLGRPTIPMGKEIKPPHSCFYYDSQRSCIRIFCRDPAKQELLAHMVEDWEENRQTRCGAIQSFEVVQQALVNEVSNGASNLSTAGPVALSQDSDYDMLSPARSVMSRSEFSYGSPGLKGPIPVPEFRMFKQTD